MEEIIKSKEVIAYKGMDFNMTCKGFHYEIGKSYKTDKVKLCEYGFHACLNPIDVLEYYSQSIKSRYFKVKLSGEVAKCDISDTKVAATEITILEEITDTFNEVIKTNEWWKNDNVLDLLYWSDGFARIKNCERQYNFIDKNGKILSEQWFEKAFEFKEGFAVVEKPIGLRNFIDANGKILSDEWFNNANSFHDGLAKVQRSDKKYNLIDKQGNYLFNEWFVYVGYFIDGFAAVQRTNGECNFIDKQGKFLSKEWFMYVYDFHEGFAIVQRVVDEKYNFIGKDGKLLSHEWFKDVFPFNNGFAKVQRTNSEWYKIDKSGNLIKN